MTDLDEAGTKAIIADATEHHRAGRWPPAIRLAKQVLAAQPSNPDALHLIGVITYQLGHIDRAIEMLCEIVRHDPAFSPAYLNLGIFYIGQSRLTEAIEALTTSAGLSPGNADIHYNLGVALQREGRLEDAKIEFEQALKCRPGFGKAYRDLADLLLVLGDFQGAIATCDALLEMDPGNERALVLKTVGLHQIGDLDGCRRLVDFDRFVRLVTIAASDGFAGIEALNTDLASEILDHPTLVYEPSLNTTRFGYQSRDILADPKGPFAVLKDLIRQAVDDYMASVAAAPPHPFFDGRPSRIEITGWAVILESGGHQTAHMHSSCWLSGVYYVVVPDAVDTGDQAGWIEFGRPEERFKLASEPEVRAYRPEEGLMVLFPSFMFHRTIPFQSDQKRICVAFDVPRNVRD